MSNRRTFLKQALAAAGVLTLSPLDGQGEQLPAGIELSLAEWSLHRTIREGKLDHLDFPLRAKEFGISAVEYVNGLLQTTTGIIGIHPQKFASRSCHRE